MDGAKTAVIANAASPIACLDGGKVVNTTVMAVGIKTPPVKPCKARKTIIELRSHDDAQQIEKKINKAVLTKRYFRCENTRDNHPVKGITTISATR